MKRIWILTALALAMCGPPHVELVENCSESAQSKRYRAEWTQRCLLSTASHDKTAPQLEQQEDLVDECTDASEKFAVRECSKPMLKYYSRDGESWRPCANATPGSDAHYACQRVADSLTQRGETFL